MCVYVRARNGDCVRYSVVVQLWAYFSVCQILLSLFVTVNTISLFFVSRIIHLFPVPLQPLASESVAFHLICAVLKLFQSAIRKQFGQTTAASQAMATNARMVVCKRARVTNSSTTMKSHLFIYFQQKRQRCIDWFFDNWNRSISWYNDFSEDDCKKQSIYCVLNTMACFGN